MNDVKLILLKGTEITTLVIGIIGLVLSLAILVSPMGLRKLSLWLNRQFSLEPSHGQLNWLMSLDMVLGWCPFISGSIVAGGSIAVIVYLFFNPMPTFSDNVLMAIGFDSLLWMARLASVLGFVFGLLLMFAPEVLRRINEKLNRWHDANAVVRHMEQTVFDFDGWILNNPRASGVMGLVMSVVLLTITINHL